MKTTYHRRRSSVTLIRTHFVFCTKYRRRVLTDRVFATLEAVVRLVCMALEVEYLELNAEGDHVHLLVRLPPALSHSTFMKRIKGASSRAIRKSRFGEVLARLHGKHLWSPSFFAVSCGGATIEKLKAYVQKQGPRPTREAVAKDRKNAVLRRRTGSPPGFKASANRRE
jgi:putative transposase